MRVVLAGYVESTSVRECSGNDASARNGGGDSARDVGVLADERRNGVAGAVLAVGAYRHKNFQLHQPLFLAYPTWH